MQCTFHPQTETVLRCSKCERPICGACAITTPVGARCAECARVQRLPQYTLPGPQLGVAIGVALGCAVALGVAFGLVSAIVPPSLSWIYAPAALAGSGHLLGEAVSRSVNRKRAPALMWVMAGGYIVAVTFFAVFSGGFIITLYTLVGMFVGSVLAMNAVR